MANGGLWDVFPMRPDQVYGAGVAVTNNPWVVAVFGGPITTGNLRAVIPDPLTEDEGDEP